MLNMNNYQIIEAIQDLLDDYELVLSRLDSEISSINEKNQILEARMLNHKPAHEKVFGYQVLLGYKKEIHFHELMKLTYQQYQDDLHEKLRLVKRNEK